MKGLLAICSFMLLACGEAKVEPSQREACVAIVVGEGAYDSELVKLGKEGKLVFLTPDEFLAGPVESCNVKGLVVSGHSFIPKHLVGMDINKFVSTVAKYKDGLAFLILETCQGASAELLGALKQAGTQIGVILASAWDIPRTGLVSDWRVLDRAIADPLQLCSEISCCEPRPFPLTCFEGARIGSIMQTVSAAQAEIEKCHVGIPVLRVFPLRVAVPLAPEQTIGGSAGWIGTDLPPERWCGGKLDPSPSEFIWYKQLGVPIE